MLSLLWIRLLILCVLLLEWSYVVMRPECTHDTNAFCNSSEWLAETQFKQRSTMAELYRAVPVPASVWNWIATVCVVPAGVPVFINSNVWTNISSWFIMLRPSLRLLPEDSASP